jgi:hypothetical protein
VSKKIFSRNGVQNQGSELSQDRSGTDAKEFSVEGGSLEDLNDEELAQAIADIRILAVGTKRLMKN